MKIALGADHGGYGFKEKIKGRLEEKGVEILDCGCFDEESCDYPDFAEKVARSVGSGEADRGILVCKTGHGMSIAANKVPGVRCANCHAVEGARLSREHNDANVLALAASFVDPATAERIVDVWLKTEFQGGRHQRRVDKIAGLEKK